MMRFWNTLATRWIVRWECRARMAYAVRGRLLVPERVVFAGSVPVGIGVRDEHPRMADGENVHLVADDFVYDAIGVDDQLVKSFGIRWQGVEALERNIWARERIMLKLRNVADDFVVPANGVLVRKLLLDRKKNVLKEQLRVWGELRCHWAALDAACLRRAARTLRDTVSSGMPLSSANSRREISTSRESSMLSISASKSVASTRYDVARPFCVMRIGRCVSRGRLMYDEKFWRHSEKGTTSSEGRQRLMGRSRRVGMVLSPLMDGIVQNLAPCVKEADERLQRLDRRRLDRLRFEEEGHNAHEGDAMVVKPRLLVRVSGDYDFAEVVVDVSKGKCLLFPFRMVWDGKCRLDVNAFGCLVHNEIDFITHCLGYYECVCQIVNVFAYGDSVRLHAHDCVECVRDFARVGKTANSAHHDGHKRIKHFITFETVPFNDIAQVNCFVEERWLFKSCEDTSFVKGGCSGCFRPKIRSAA